MVDMAMDLKADSLMVVLRLFPISHEIKIRKISYPCSYFARNDFNQI